MTVNTNSPPNIQTWSVSINGSFVVNGVIYFVPSTSWVLNVNPCMPSFTLTTQPEGTSLSPFTFTIYQDT
jgi:hypothetical protein